MKVTRVISLSGDCHVHVLAIKLIGRYLFQLTTGGGWEWLDLNGCPLGLWLIQKFSV